MEETIDHVSAESQFVYGDFGTRLMALIIDNCIIVGIAFLIFGDDVVNTSSGIEVSFNGIENLLFYTYGFLCWVLMSSSPGKMLFGLKIVDRDGNKITPMQSLIRVVLYYFVLIVGGWFILGNDKKQGVHDIVAKTYVIKK